MFLNDTSDEGTQHRSISIHGEKLYTTKKGKIDSNTIIEEELIPYLYQWTEYIDIK